jgi:hypothetical protein
MVIKAHAYYAIQMVNFLLLISTRGKGGGGEYTNPSGLLSKCFHAKEF